MSKKTQEANQMTTLSIIKRELTKTFEEVKFSISTTSHNLVYIEWSLEIGTNATVDAVIEILKKHETSVHYRNSIDNTLRSSKLIVVPRPKYTKERKDWTVAEVVNIFADTAWNAKSEYFKQGGRKEQHYQATEQYQEYLDNGVTSEMLDRSVKNFLKNGSTSVNSGNGGVFHPMFLFS